MGSGVYIIDDIKITWPGLACLLILTLKWLVLKYRWLSLFKVAVLLIGWHIHKFPVRLK